MDDHLIEPPDMFQGRMPSKYTDQTPRVVDKDDGSQVWIVGHREVSTIGLSAVVGRVDDDWSTDPTRFDEMRQGCLDPLLRAKDMDIAGIVASVCFPSALPGFAGRSFATFKDEGFGLALVNAWNNWLIEEWVAAAPERFVPVQLPWLRDPIIAADLVRRNAELGFRAVTFSENPAVQHLPSLHTRHWDPFFEACQETDTVVCIHAGSSGWTPVVAQEAPLSELTTSFILNAMAAAADWVWSGIPARFPDLKIALAEGGFSWVPALVERLDYVAQHSLKATPEDWPWQLSPSEAFLRSFWFCGLHDPAGIELRERIGVDHLMIEVDYPHADSTWPESQHTARAMLDQLPVEEAAAIAYGTASKLFRHPVEIDPDEWRGLSAGGTRELHHV